MIDSMELTGDYLLIPKIRFAEQTLSVSLMSSIGKIGFYGKTGTGRNHNTNRLEAWCVGFLEYPDGGIVYYAAHGADRKRDVLSSEIRDSIRQIVSKGQGGAASGNGNG